MLRASRTNTLAVAFAREIGCTGYAGEASGQGFDARCENSYPPND